MANYLKGIGNPATRVNEILPSFDAKILNFLTGHMSGIIRGEFYEFDAYSVDRGVAVKGGLMQAHGYFGCCDTETQINFVMPSTTQYVNLYAEIDLSVVPNRFEIKATPLSNSTAWTPRQDNLRSTTNGRFQFPLWQVRLTATTITLTDKRIYIQKPLNAVNAEHADSGTTLAQTDSSNRVATTSYVRQAISDVKNIEYGTVGGVAGAVKRQVNFVILHMTAYVGGTNTVVGTIPEGFRPKTNMTIGATVTLSGAAMAYYPEQINVYGAAGATVSTDGTVTVSGMWMGGGQYIATVGQLSGTATISGGWEI
jgi:hypothetical protein